MQEREKWKWSHSVVSDSSRPHGLQPTRLLCPWDFPGKSTRVGCHCLLQNCSLEGVYSMNLNSNNKKCTIQSLLFICSAFSYLITQKKLNFNKENYLYNLIKVWGIRLKLPLVQYVCINAGMCMCVCVCVCIVCIGGSIVRFSFLLEIYSLQFHNSLDSCLNFDHFLCYVLHNYSQNSKKIK